MTEPGRFHHLTMELLASLSADEIADAIVTHVDDRAGGDRSGRTRVLPSLAPGVRAVYTTWLVDRAVNAGGFAGFVREHGEAVAGEALAAYEWLGVEEYAAIMRSAIASVATASEGIATDYTDVDQRYYALGDRIYTAWAVAVRDRPVEFVT